MTRFVSALCAFLFTAVAFGQPIVIDGQFDSSEWSGASSYTFTVNLPGSGTTSGEIYIIADASNVYTCVRYQQSGLWDAESVAVLFDAKQDQQLGQHDDGIVLSTEDSCVQTKVFTDIYYYTGGACPPSAVCSEPDPDDGGTHDGNGAVDNDGTWTVHEMWHPLNSADDAHDINFGPGDKLGFLVNVRLLDASSNFADSYYPGPGFTAFELYFIP